ncbi:MAG: hypothetical protein ACE5FW_02925 [Candidatus Aenigmatarchaeota archaeon]
MHEEMVSDKFRKLMHKLRITGPVLCGGPFEMEMILDFTGLRGSGSNIYLSYVYQIPKWDYVIFKVDEFVEVTPEWAEYYNLTMAQKQKLMETIKGGLVSAAEAVSHYELLAHDERRYREILDYFKAGMKDEHVLRSLFVDRVDAYTGEGYSLITMAKRWPTIITDFIRMKSEWEDVDTIRKELDVSQAEATVLKTKNELYKEWKRLFEPTVKERYARIKNLAEARKKSIEEYRKWLKPYVVQHQMIRERAEKEPAAALSTPYFTPGFGQSQALTGVKTWCWKPLVPAEIRKPEMGPLGPSGFIVDPYDDIVKKWAKEIEKKYKIEIYEDEKEVKQAIKEGKTPSKYRLLVREILEWAKTKDVNTNLAPMDPSKVYYVFFEANFLLSLVKTPPPEALETDNLMVWPFKAWFMSQNALLIHILEIKAREKAMEKYVDELIGATEREEEYLKMVEEEFKEEKPVRFTGVRNFARRARNAGSRVRFGLDMFIHVFIRRGPYETVFFERVSKMFARGIGGYYKQQIDFIKEKMGTW